MRRGILMMVLLLAAACGSKGEGSGTDAAGGMTGAPSLPGAGGAGGNAGSGGAGGGGAVPAADAGNPTSTPGCRFDLGGSACSPTGTSCASTSECTSVRCDCVNARWVCSERKMPCGGTCPTAQEARCGDPCTGTATNCLCQCGGPNFSGCACANGRWQCACGR